MTKDKNRKTRVRARMERTGESYTAARAQVAKASSEKAIPLPTERRHMSMRGAHGCAPGDYPWDHWFARARTAGLKEELANLGRSLVREADQHSWCLELRERCGWTEESAEGMVRFALEQPQLAEEHWSRLMDTDGFYGVYVETGDGFRELTDLEFEQGYAAFARAFDAYFPADRIAADDPDPLVDVPGVPGVLAPRSRVAKLEAELAAREKGPKAP